MASIKTVTCSAPVNIAVIKYCEYRSCYILFQVRFYTIAYYSVAVTVVIVCRIYLYWLTTPLSLTSGGKRDETLIIPTNSSLSVCLDQDQVSEHVCVYV